ncbi:MAG: hypothetical protein AAGA28_01630 [Pseudomonadota bacterium]
MSDQDQTPQTPAGFYSTPKRRGVIASDIVALAASVIWIAATGLFFWLGSEPDGLAGYPMRVAVTVLVVILPVAMIWVAAASARTGEAMRRESLRLQLAADAISKVAAQMQGEASLSDQQNAASASMNLPDTYASQPPQAASVSEKLSDIATTRRPPDAVIAPFSTSRAAAVLHETNVHEDPGPDTAHPHDSASEDTSGFQADLPLESDIPATPPVGISDFIRALNFPLTADDREGFAALRRALRTRETARIVQASEDVLTLLSQDGIYMDDLPPDRARPELWRRFAEGERGRQIAALGGIHDRASLTIAAARMKQDTIFRDAAHHFLRLFDQTMSRFCLAASDAEISALSDTRTARAFMLLGRAAGTFD